MTDDATLTARFHEMYDRSLNHGDFEPTYRMCHPDIAFQSPAGMMRGVENVVALIRQQRAAFDDFEYIIEHIFANDEGVGVVSLSRGVHMRALMGVEGSGRAVEIRMLSIHRVVDGRSAGGWTCSRYSDILREAYEQAAAQGTLPCR
ncbi:ester cyclase [Novosphingobium sp. AP12]|uniref:ester cyclase n=1 Tax=Novosphingobium sp. AP12 TaxID=1144305 RepID=UPI0002720006|nr:ester cyclase [Novosphingobium sp. AP12]EJL30838.1 putative ester cyclase [Novosphingobium sp. AP12]